MATTLAEEPTKTQAHKHDLTVSCRQTASAPAGTEQNLCANDSRDGTCAIQVRKALLGQPSMRHIVHIELDAPLHEAGSNVRELEVDHAQDRLAGEPVEDDHRIEPVQQLRWELLLDALRTSFCSLDVTAPEHPTPWGGLGCHHLRGVG